MQKTRYFLLSILLLASRLASAQTTPASDGRTLQFIPNQGQWPAAVRYAGAVPGGHLYLEPTGLRYVLLEAVRHPHEKAPKAGPLTRPAAALKAGSLPAADSPIRGHQLRVRFVGADVATPLVPAETTGETYNYLQGNDPAQWAKGVPSYRQVRYQAPWPGIGARFYENKQQQLEYDFELAAGANPALVKLKYQGASSLRLGSDGRLHVGTSVASLTELAPQAYQNNPTTGQPQPVACHYRLNLTDSTVTFALGQYDHSRPLVIDPTVQFSTYTGASGDNWGFTATYDAAGNMYSGGIVLNQNSPASFPTTTGAFQTTFGGIIDIAIIKYNTAVNGAASRVWATYLGGSSHDYPSSLVVNSQNELVMLGTTSSPNYPTSASALQKGFRGGFSADPFGDSADGQSFYQITQGTDIVVTRLTSSGGLAASTYLGGSGTDGLVPYEKNLNARQLPQNYGDAFRGDVLTDAAGNIYVASVTSSPDFPVTSGSFGSSGRGGSSDAVVMKLPAALNTVTWGGYLGGNAADAAYSLQLDASSNVYVTGGTLSPNFPVTSGALLTTAQGNVDGFVARIAANGASIQRATYLGTSSYDQSYFLQLGADGGVYLLGQTMGTWPTTTGTYRNPGTHQFIQKLSADLDQRLLSTVFGNDLSRIDISPTAFLVDQCDRVYVCGWGGSNNQNVYKTGTFNFNGYTHGLPVTANAVRSTPDTPNAGSDFYLAQFSPGLTSLLYGTFYGDAGVNSVGDHVDGGTSRFDPRGVVYTAVCSCRNVSGFPVPAGAYTYSTTNNSSNCNNAAFKLNFEPQTATVGLDQTVCSTAAAVPLRGTPSGGVWTGAGVTTSATGYVFTPSAALVGVQTLTYTLAGVIPVCTATGTQRITVVAVGPAVLSALPQEAYCLQPGATSAPVALMGSPAGGVFSGPGVTGNQFSPTAAGPGQHTLTYVLGAGTPCASTATRVVTVVQATAGAALTVCVSSGAVALASGRPVGGTWSGPGVSGAVATGYVFTPTATMSGTTQTLTYSVAAPDGSCAATTTQTITVLPRPQVNAPTLPGVCVGSGAVALTVGQPAGGTWLGPGVSGSATSGYVFTPTAALIGTQTLTYSIISVQGCSGEASITVDVSPAAVQVAMPADTALCPGSSRAFQLHASPASGVWSGVGVTASGLFTPPSTPGTVAMRYTMGGGTPCATSATRRITLLAAPTLAPAEQPLVCRADSSVANSSAPAVAPYTVRFSQPGTTLLADAVLTWDFGDGSAPATGLSVAHTYATAGSFQPTATLRYSGSRCSVQVSLAPVQVQEPLVPNVFTPNGDNQNDFFAPRLGGCQPRLQVFTRWGQKVYESPAYFNNWDGGGQAAGIYYFLITPTDGRAPLKGWVELIR